jgi:hypothetical protein
VSIPWLFFVIKCSNNPDAAGGGDMDNIMIALKKSLGIIAVKHYT